MTPLSIKVCGMTEAENIREVEQLGVDMIGFIFYPKSPRCLCELPDYLPVHAKRVGVFVNENKENILMYADRFALDYIQLGPYGFSPKVYEAAHEKLSLSRMTFSHQMIRLIFVEQLYRAMTILNGAPYHHE